MLNLLRAEWYKLCRNRTFWLLLVVLAVSAAVYCLLNYFDEQEGELAGETSGISLLLSAMGGNNYIIKIGLSVLAGFFISSEYSTGTIKRGAASGYSRSRLIAAKLLVFIGGSALVALVFPVVCLATGTLLLGLGTLPAGAGTAAFIVKALCMTVALSAGFAALTGAIAVYLTDSGKTIGLCFVFYFFADGLYVIVGKYMPAVKTLYKYSIFNLINLYGDPGIGDAAFARTIYIPLLVAAVCVGLGIAVFSRKEIK